MKQYDHLFHHSVMRSYRYPLMMMLCVCMGCYTPFQVLVKKDREIFEKPMAKKVTPLIEEISGIAASKINSGCLWAEEDGGNVAGLILLSYTGNVMKRVPINNVTNRDWEDMAIVGNQLYIADIGDNKLQYPDYTIYQFTELDTSVNVIDNVHTIRFKYPDGSHDAEAFLVDPETKDIYIITKRDKPSRLYRLAYPQSFTSVNLATYTGSLSYSGVVSAAISTDGRSIIVKTYFGLRLYKRKDNEDLCKTLSGKDIKLPYHLEPQGEAVTFAPDNAGFYTLSEKGMAGNVRLYFYKQK